MQAPPRPTKRSSSIAPPAAPQKKGGLPAGTIPDPVPFSFETKAEVSPDRIVLYGVGGIGKTSLAAWLPGVVFLDLENGAKRMDVARTGVSSWLDLRSKIAYLTQNPNPKIKSVVIDTGTVAEQFAIEYVVENRPKDNGDFVNSLEGYGYNKGRDYVYEQFHALIADLDRLSHKANVNVCIITHAIAAEAPTTGEAYPQWQPSVYGGDKKGKSSIRDRLKGWADFVVFLNYDLHVSGGKATTTSARRAYAFETTTFIGKSRSEPVSVPYTLDDPARVWRELGVWGIETN